MKVSYYMEVSHDEELGGLGTRSGRTAWASDDSGRNHGSKRGRRRSRAEVRLGGVRETDGSRRVDLGGRRIIKKKEDSGGRDVGRRDRSARRPRRGRQGRQD